MTFNLFYSAVNLIAAICILALECDSNFQADAGVQTGTGLRRSRSSSCGCPKEGTRVCGDLTKRTIHRNMCSFKCEQREYPELKLREGNGFCQAGYLGFPPQGTIETPSEPELQRNPKDFLTPEILSELDNCKCTKEYRLVCGTSGTKNKIYMNLCHFFCALEKDSNITQQNSAECFSSS